MLIQINLADAKCSAGSVIAGTVSLHGREDIYVQSIIVILQAHCKTRWTVRATDQSTHIYYGKVRLFKVSKELFKGPHTLHPGHAWPFTIDLPLQCNASQIKPSKKKDGPFNYDPEQSLPPSFSRVCAGSSCSIRYEIQASLIRGRFKILPFRHLHDTKQLYLKQLREIQSLDQQRTHETRAISCYGQDKPSTFKEKWKSFWRTNPPDARFKVQTKLRKFVIAGQLFHVFFRLDLDSGESTAIEPPLLLSKTQIKLRGWTSVRDDRNKRFGWGDSCGMPPLHNLEEIETKTSLRKHWMKFSVRLPTDVVPTFTTFNIKRTYRLHFRLSVHYGQKILEPEFWTQEFIVFPAECKPSEGGDQRAASLSVSSEAAPAYQDVVEPTPPSYREVKIS